MNTAFRAVEIGPLPPSPKDRMRIGEELQPIGTYAGIIPYSGTIQDVEVLQEHEKSDPEFESKDWWWDHQRIRFLNEKLGLKFLVLLLPVLWVFTLTIGGLGLVVWGVVQLSESYGFPAFLHLLLLFILVPGWLLFSFWAIRPTTNWFMSTGMGFVLKPFERCFSRQLALISLFKRRLSLPLVFPGSTWLSRRAHNS